MLGATLGTLRGRVTGQRVLPSTGSAARTEISFEISGTLLGVKVTMLGTYWSVARPGGTLYGECPNQGVLMTSSGQAATWTGAGMGHFTGKGSGVSFRGAIYVDGGGPKLARLTRMAIVYEWDVAADGSAEARFMEWK
jgi:hypothetical protein